MTLSKYVSFRFLTEFKYGNGFDLCRSHTVCYKSVGLC